MRQGANVQQGFLNNRTAALKLQGPISVAEVAGNKIATFVMASKCA